MSSSAQIIERMNFKKAQTDLGLIYDIWHNTLRDDGPLRSSEQIAIRKAAVALDRIGDSLSRVLALDSAATHRALPEITSTTRVRKTPERFWLEIDTKSKVDNSHDRAVVYLEFSQTGVKLGVRLPNDPSSRDFDELSQLRLLKALDQSEYTGWNIEQSRPPADQRACSSNLNTWLSGRAHAKQKDDYFPTLNTNCTSIRPPLEDLVKGVKRAAILTEKINNHSLELYQTKKQSSVSISFS